MSRDDQVVEGSDPDEKIRRVQAEFLMMCFLGGGISTLFCAWVIAFVVTPDGQSPWRAAIPILGAGFVYIEFLIVRRWARALLGDHIDELLPGLGGGGPAGSRRLWPSKRARNQAMATTIAAAGVGLAALAPGMILCRFLGPLPAVAVFSTIMLVGMSAVGIAIVLRR